MVYRTATVVRFCGFSATAEVELAQLVHFPNGALSSAPYSLRAGCDAGIARRAAVRTGLPTRSRSTSTQFHMSEPQILIVGAGLPSGMAQQLLSRLESEFQRSGVTVLTAPSETFTFQNRYDFSMSEHAQDFSFAIPSGSDKLVTADNGNARAPSFTEFIASRNRTYGASRRRP